MAAGAHFVCPKFIFDRISGHFRSIYKFFFGNFLTKWLASAILDVRDKLSITFLAILDQYVFFFAKWPPAPNLDVRNSLLITFLAISDRYVTLIFFEFFYLMAAVGHFGCPKLTFDRISLKFLQNGRRRPFWMSEIHFRSHFWPF